MGTQSFRTIGNFNANVTNYKDILSLNSKRSSELFKPAFQTELARQQPLPGNRVTPPSDFIPRAYRGATIYIYNKTMNINTHIHFILVNNTLGCFSIKALCRLIIASFHITRIAFCLWSY